MYSVGKLAGLSKDLMTCFIHQIEDDEESEKCYKMCNELFRDKELQNIIFHNNKVIRSRVLLTI